MRLKKQVAVKRGRVTNPTGKGGFKDHPEAICRDGAAKSKGRQFQMRLRDWLEETCDDGLTRDEKFLAYVEDIAASGGKSSLDAIKLLWEYAHGKPVQRNELTGADGKDLLSGPSLSEFAAKMGGRVIPAEPGKDVT